MVHMQFVHHRHFAEQDGDAEDEGREQQAAGPAAKQIPV